MNGKPLFRGTVDEWAILNEDQRYLALIGEALPSDPDNPNLWGDVEVWRAGDRPVPPTRDQVEQARGAVAFLFHTMASPTNDARREAYQDVKTVLDALSGGVPTEPARPSSGCPYVFGPYSCVKRSGHEGEHLGSTTGEWVPTEPEETADGHD